MLGAVAHATRPTLAGIIAPALFALGKRFGDGFGDGFVAIPLGPRAGELRARTERRPLAVAVGTDRQQRRLRVGDHHPHEPVARRQLDPAHAAGVAPHRARVGFGEADRHPLCGGEDELVPRPRDHGVDELVSVAELDGDQPLRAPPLVFLERGLLHDPAASGEHEELPRILEARHRAAVGHLLPLLELEEVDEGPPLGVAGELGQLEDAEREHLPVRREHEEEVVGAGDEEVLDRILFVAPGASQPLPSAALGPVGIGGGALHVPGPADRHDHRRFGDQLGHVADITRLAADLGAPIVAMFFGKLDELRPDHAADVCLAGEEPAEVTNLAEQLAVFAGELLLFEIDQLPEGEPENGVGLDGGEAIGLRHPTLLLEHREAPRTEGTLEERRRSLDLGQPLLRLGLGAGAANDPDHLVEVRQRHEQTLEGVLAAAGLLEEVLGAPAEDRRAVTEKLLENVLEREDPRLAVDQCQEDEREGRLERGELVELVQHDLGVGVALQLQNEPDRFLQIALVADRRDPPDPILVDELGDLLLDRVPALLIGDFRDHDPIAILGELFDRGPRPEGDRAPAGGVAAGQRFAPHHDPAGGEIGARHDLKQLAEGDAGVVDERDQRLADLAEVVGGDARRHADGDAAGAIDEEVGEPPRQDDRLGVPLVVGGDVVDGVELEIGEHHRRDRRQPGLGVPHGGRGKAGDRAEIALLVDEHMPHVPFLGHAHEGGIDDALAVRVVVAAGVAGDLGALHPGSAGGEIEVVHRHEDAALRWLEAVTDIGQRPGHDDAHRVGQVAVLQLLLDRQLDQPPTGTVAEHTRLVSPTAARATGPARRPPGPRFLVVRMLVCQRPLSQLSAAAGNRRKSLNIPVSQAGSTGPGTPPNQPRNRVCGGDRMA